jgi:hypothetical protein
MVDTIAEKVEISVDSCHPHHKKAPEVAPNCEHITTIMLMQE